MLGKACPSYLLTHTLSFFTIPMEVGHSHVGEACWAPSLIIYAVKSCFHGWETRFCCVQWMGEETHDFGGLRGHFSLYSRGWVCWAFFLHDFVFFLIFPCLEFVHLGCLVVTEPSIPDLEVCGGRFCPHVAHKRFLSWDLHFGVLWWPFFPLKWVICETVFAFRGLFSLLSNCF